MALEKLPRKRAPDADDIALAQIELAREDLLASRAKLAQVSVDALAEIRRNRERFRPYMGDASQALREALIRGSEGLIEDARANLEAQLERLDRGGVIDLTDGTVSTDLGEQGVIANAS